MWVWVDSAHSCLCGAGLEGHRVDRARQTNDGRDRAVRGPHRPLLHPVRVRGCRGDAVQRAAAGRRIGQVASAAHCNPRRYVLPHVHTALCVHRPTPNSKTNFLYYSKHPGTPFSRHCLATDGASRADLRPCFAPIQPPPSPRPAAPASLCPSS